MLLERIMYIKSIYSDKTIDYQLSGKQKHLNPILTKKKKVTFRGAKEKIHCKYIHHN